MSVVVQFVWRHAAAAFWNEDEEQTQVRSVLTKGEWGATRENSETY